MSLTRFDIYYQTAMQCLNWWRHGGIFVFKELQFIPIPSCYKSFGVLSWLPQLGQSVVSLCTCSSSQITCLHFDDILRPAYVILSSHLAPKYISRNYVYEIVALHGVVKCRAVVIFGSPRSYCFCIAFSQTQGSNVVIWRLVIERVNVNFMQFRLSITIFCHCPILGASSTPYTVIYAYLCMNVQNINFCIPLTFLTSYSRLILTWNLMPGCSMSRNPMAHLTEYYFHSMSYTKRPPPQVGHV